MKSHKKRLGKRQLERYCESIEVLFNPVRVTGKDGKRYFVASYQGKQHGFETLDDFRRWVFKIPSNKRET
jgi:hypothetical protein